jgi:iron complex outermembrane receptor protein
MALVPPRGFTSGGYNAESLTAGAFCTPFAPETVNSVEAGVKSQWLQSRLCVNACIFKMKYRDKQELVNNSLTGILAIVNAGKASVAGGELEVAYKAAPWLDLSASYASLDGHYNRFVVGTVNNSGNPLSNSPRNQHSAAANMSIPVSSGYVVGAASYAWKDTYNTGAANDPNPQLLGFGLANLSAGIESEYRAWRPLAWVKNANDIEYVLTCSTQVVRARYLGEPRTFGISLRARY